MRISRTGAAELAFLTPGEPRIAARARKQHGAVARWQLLEDRLPAHRIDARVRSGRLRPVYRGVYEVMGMTTSHTSSMAAVLACGEGAMLCGGSAAALWAMAEGSAGQDVLVEGAHRRVRGIRTHRVRALVAGEATTLHHIPVTTPARTLLDIARVLSRRRLEQALATALRTRIVTEAELRALLDRRSRHRGAAPLVALLDGVNEPAFTRSPLEERFLRLVEHVGLPRPRVNVWIAGLEVDCAWPDHGLVVELDGARHHMGERAWHTDRERDRRLVARGYRVMRMTAKLLDEDPVKAMVGLTEALLTTGRRTG